MKLFEKWKLKRRYSVLKSEFNDEIVQLCSESIIDIDNPSYSELLLLTDSDKLANMRIDNLFTKNVLQHALRASYVILSQKVCLSVGA